MKCISSSFQKQRGVKKEEFINNCVATVVNTGCAENIFFVHLVYIFVFQADLIMICFVVALHCYLCFIVVYIDALQKGYWKGRPSTFSPSKFKILHPLGARLALLRSGPIFRPNFDLIFTKYPKFAKVDTAKLGPLAINVLTLAP